MDGGKGVRGGGGGGGRRGYRGRGRGRLYTYGCLQVSLAYVHYPCEVVWMRERDNMNNNNYICLIL